MERSGSKRARRTETTAYVAANVILVAVAALVVSLCLLGLVVVWQAIA